jgi:ketosteroid isomerase-like protein
MSAADAAVVEKFLSAITAFDVETALSCLHPDCRVEEAASLPYGGTHVGVEGFMAIFTKLTEVAAPAFESFEVFDAGRRVIGRIELLLTAHASGNQLRMTVVEIYTVSDGAITSADVYYKDTKALAEFLASGAAA